MSLPTRVIIRILMCHTEVLVWTVQSAQSCYGRIWYSLVTWIQVLEQDISLYKAFRLMGISNYGRSEGTGCTTKHRFMSCRSHRFHVSHGKAYTSTGEFAQWHGFSSSLRILVPSNNLRSLSHLTNALETSKADSREVACYPLPAPYSVTITSMYTRDRRWFPQLTSSDSNGRYSYNCSTNDNRSTSRSSMVVEKDTGQVSVNAAKRTTHRS
jgi:hypothetical protein